MTISESSERIRMGYFGWGKTIRNIRCVYDTGYSDTRRTPTWMATLTRLRGRDLTGLRCAK
jgi:hypothetical protein